MDSSIGMKLFVFGLGRYFFEINYWVDKLIVIPLSPRVRWISYYLSFRSLCVTSIPPLSVCLLEVLFGFSNSCKANYLFFSDFDN